MPSYLHFNNKSPLSKFSPNISGVLQRHFGHKNWFLGKVFISKYNSDIGSCPSNSLEKLDSVDSCFSNSLFLLKKKDSDYLKLI